MRFRRSFVSLFVLFLVACSGGPEQPPADQEAPRTAPLIVIGIDGAEWSVIRELWDEGRLPNLRSLAERGVTSELKTRYSSSPVIWTTIATGRRPQEHGITDFVVATPEGDVPVSSTVRRVPAIWNMVSTVDRRVAVLGWWATWPAETDVNGVVVSDRALLDTHGRVAPEELLPLFEQLAAEALAAPMAFNSNPAASQRDQVVAHLARRLVDDGNDLLLAYFRGVDIASHNYWKYYRPESYAKGGVEIDAEGLAAFAQRIPEEYEAVDRAIGAILAAADPEPNVLVISDHGFEPAEEEIVKVVLDFDRVLAELGFLVRHDGEIDFAASQLYSFASPDFRATKWLRYALAARPEGGGVEDHEKAEIRSRLENELARLTYTNGEPIFTVREPLRQEKRRQVDLVVEVDVTRPTPGLLKDGRPALEGTIQTISRVSGTHGNDTHGILLAAGPDIDPGAELEGIRIHDMAPTMLYALGLPVAEDFAGRAWVELFDEDFRGRHPLRTIASWGAEDEGFASPSTHDQQLIDELRALGYLD